MHPLSARQFLLDSAAALADLKPFHLLTAQKG
jgi:hypothetical protein